MAFLAVRPSSTRLASRATRSRRILALCAVCFLCSCGSDEPARVENVSGKDGRGGQGESGEKRGRGPRKLDPVAVAVEVAHLGTIADTYTATATLESLREADVLARVNGVITETRAEEGDSVSTGDLLMRIQDEEYRLRVRQARAETSQLQSQYDRAKRMAAGEFIAAEEVEVSEHALEAAKASLALSELDLSHTKVKAPFAGHVVRRHVDAGQNVSSTSALYTIADLSKLRAVVHVPAREFREIRTGQRVELVLDSTRQTVDGTVSLVSPVIDANSGTVRVTIDILDYPPGTRPGDFAEVHIVTDERNGAVLIPRDAAFSDGADVVVYVASPDSVAERRVVEVGFETDTYSEIVDGVTDGEWVVVQGQRNLKPMSPLRILPPLVFDDAPTENETAS
jgi:RND family efflux transporter MFP subunit